MTWDTRQIHLSTSCTFIPCLSHSASSTWIHPFILFCQSHYFLRPKSKGTFHETLTSLDSSPYEVVIPSFLPMKHFLCSIINRRYHIIYTHGWVFKYLVPNIMVIVWSYRSHSLVFIVKPWCLIWCLSHNRYIENAW